MRDHENNHFRYVYSAREQAEIRRIREKYAPGEAVEDKMERLRRLDARVTSRAQVVSLIFGIVGALILGTGMSFFMTELGEGLGAAAIVLGVLFGVVGGTLAAFAYPMYNLVLRREREKVAPEIIRLTDELLK